MPMLWLHGNSGQSACKKFCAKWERGRIPRWLGPSCTCEGGQREVEIVRVYPRGRSVKLGQRVSCRASVVWMQRSKSC
jgi:hypothetical protein